MESAYEFTQMIPVVLCHHLQKAEDPAGAQEEPGAGQALKITACASPESEMFAAAVEKLLATWSERTCWSTAARHLQAASVCLHGRCSSRQRRKSHERGGTRGLPTLRRSCRSWNWLLIVQPDVAHGRHNARQEPLEAIRSPSIWKPRVVPRVVRLGNSARKPRLNSAERLIDALWRRADGALRTWPAISLCAKRCPFTARSCVMPTFAALVTPKPEHLR